MGYREQQDDGNGVAEPGDELQPVVEAEAQHPQQLIAGRPVEERDRNQHRGQHPGHPAVSPAECVGDGGMQERHQRHQHDGQDPRLEEDVADDRRRVGVLAAGEVCDRQRLADRRHGERDRAGRQHERQQPPVSRTEEAGQEDRRDEPRDQREDPPAHVEGERAGEEVLVGALRRRLCAAGSGQEAGRGHGRSACLGGRSGPAPRLSCARRSIDTAGVEMAHRRESRRAGRQPSVPPRRSSRR